MEIRAPLQTGGILPPETRAVLRNESILAVDYRIDGETLYRYHGRVVERLVPWGPEAAAWRFAADAWQPFIPEIDLSDIEENAWNPGATRWPSWRRRVAACQFLIDRWPEEARDSVREFPSAHWQLLQFANAGGPPALELLRSNPALGYLAALAGAVDQVGLRRRSLAARFGFPETEHAVRLLRKVPAAWISPELLAELRTAVAHEPDAEAFLTRLAGINPVALEVARDAALRGSFAPACMARLSRLPASVPLADLIARIRELPRQRIRTLADLDRTAHHPAAPARRVRPARPAEDLAIPHPLPQGTPPGPPPAAPLRLAPVPALLASPSLPRRTARVFPAPPLPDFMAAGVQISAIRSQPDLAAESDAMHHCAGRDRSYARRVVAGNLYFYRMLDPERLTIAIRRAGSGWAVEDIRGFCNRFPGAYARALVWDWVGKRAEP